MTQTTKTPRRKTPAPPLCPIHTVPLLVRHASRTRQYRYCRVAGCGETQQSDRVSRLKNPMCLWLRGIVNETGRVILYPAW
jgi:hypothetical protein